MFETVSKTYRIEYENLSINPPRQNLLTRGPWRPQLEQLLASKKNVQNCGVAASSFLSSKVVFVKKFRGERDFEAQGLDGVADSLKIRIYVRVWSRIFRISSQTPMEKSVSEKSGQPSVATKRRRTAVNQLGRDPAAYPKPPFTREDQELLAVHIEEARRHEWYRKE